MHEYVLKFLHIGDIHLGREFNINGNFGDNYSIRREEIWRSFENALEFATNNGISLVLIPGDLYENSSISLSDLDRLTYLFKKFINLKIIISLGNHDYISVKSEYLKANSPDNVFIFGPNLEYIELNNKVRIYGFSWSQVEYSIYEFPDIRLDNDFINILSIHGTDSSNTSYLPLDVKKLESLGFDYIALSHIHIPGKIGEKTYYSGSLEPLSFADIGERGGYIVELSKRDLVSKFINLSTRQYEILEFDVSLIKNNSELFNEIDNLLENIDSKNLLRLKLIGQHDRLDLNSLGEIFSHRLFYFEILDLTTRKIDVLEILEENKDNLLGRYLEHVLENYSDRDRDVLIDIALEVFPWREEFET